jgi:hypothetical protein
MRFRGKVPAFAGVFATGQDLQNGMAGLQKRLIGSIPPCPDDLGTSIKIVALQGVVDLQRGQNFTISCLIAQTFNVALSPAILVGAVSPQVQSIMTGNRI